MSGRQPAESSKYLYSQVVERIKEMIRSGEFRAGERLPPERALAETFHVSRNCLRQAIQALAERRVLQSRRGAGTYVCAPDDSPLVDSIALAIQARKSLIREILEFRVMMEPPVAALAARNITREELDRLKVIVCDQERRILAGAEDAELDASFHFVLAEAARNRVVMRVVGTLDEILDESRSQPFWSDTRRKASILGHLKIIDALEAGDPDAAAAAMREHLRSVEQIVLGSGEPGDRSGP